MAAGDYATPASPRYVYEMYDEAGACIYVGCTWNPKTRFSQHKSKSWWDEVAKTVITKYPDEKSGRAGEKKRIERLQPRHNRYLTAHYIYSGWDSRRQNDRLRHERGEECLPHKHCHVCKSDRGLVR